MGRAAGVLGRAFGLNAQEMNFVLKEDGFLEGRPGAYRVTEKGKKYAQEEDHVRGTGGSLQYNPSWTTRTWSDDIVDELDISDERRREVQREVSAARREARASAHEAAEAEEDSSFSHSDGNSNRSGLAADAVAALILLSGIGLYKASPHIKRWYVETAAPGVKKMAKRIRPRSNEEKEDPQGEEEV